jgi:hypothetical protein
MQSARRQELESAADPGCKIAAASSSFARACGMFLIHKSGQRFLVDVMKNGLPDTP